MSDERDAALSSISSLRDKRAKYQRVKNAISTNNLGLVKEVGV